jgi:CRP-like cAMP-binding protein
MSEVAAPLAPLLRKLECWAFLNDEDREALLALPHILKTIEAHHYIVREGDKPTHSCLMLSGLSYRHKVVATGARQIVSIHMSGDIVDLQNSVLGTADHNVQVLTKSEVAFIPREAVLQLAFDRRAIGQALWYDTLVDGSIFREWIANVGRRDARTRIAHLLCEFALRLEAAGLGNHMEWELPMTQEQLADCTGLTPVHVNRMLQSLGKDGLISRTRRSVTVNDWKALAHTGDFESAYLHMPEHKLSLIQQAFPA